MKGPPCGPGVAQSWNRSWSARQALRSTESEARNPYEGANGFPSSSISGSGPFPRVPCDEIPPRQPADRAADEHDRDLVFAQMLQPHPETNQPDGDQDPYDHAECHEESHPLSL